VTNEAETWTRYLLSPTEFDAFSCGLSAPFIHRLDHFAKFTVATVTGANSFFTVPSAVVEKYALNPWVKRLIPRMRHAPGLVFSDREWRALSETDTISHLLDFGTNLDSDRRSDGLSAYLQIGEDQSLPDRYKCRTRSPWYRVPVVAPGEMLMAKRSHWYPRVVVNEAQAHSTDTIYAGRIRRGPISPRDFCAGFHNSLTLLSAEIEGRSFGGGVLELVPSEVSRLAVFGVPNLALELTRLDGISRETDDDGTALVSATNEALISKLGLPRDFFSELELARRRLAGRRLART
jgi:hypothetical protein